jgi:hypothetical protein
MKDEWGSFYNKQKDYDSFGFKYASLLYNISENYIKSLIDLRVKCEPFSTSSVEQLCRRFPREDHFNLWLQSRQDEREKLEIQLEFGIQRAEPQIHKVKYYLELLRERIIDVRWIRRQLWVFLQRLETSPSTAFLPAEARPTMIEPPPPSQAQGCLQDPPGGPREEQAPVDPANRPPAPTVRSCSGWFSGTVAVRSLAG